MTEQTQATMALHLTPEALDWSLRHHLRYGDSDLFPQAFEFDVAAKSWPDLRVQLATLDLAHHNWRPGRSLLVMKDQVSFRRATQFDPIDSVLFGALMWTVAPRIEARRPSRAQNVVFSYRFEGSSSGQLFAQGKAKQAFWTHTVDSCKGHDDPWLLTTDIADYYSQIRHSLLKRELDATVQPAYSDAVMRALEAVQGNGEIGVPVGPHSAHLLAELMMVPFDEYMLDENYTLLRFVDDIHVVCASEDEVREALYDIADYMHSHCQLSLSRHKTQVLDAEGMRAYARTALGTVEEGNEDGRRMKIDELVDEHTSANDDEDVDLSELNDEFRASLDPDSLEKRLRDLLDRESQIRLRKYLQVLAHLRAPGAVEWVSKNLSSMLPALPQAIDYLLVALPRFNGDRASVFDGLLKAMELPIVVKSEHMQTLILAVCVQFPQDVAFKKVSPLYKRVRPAAQREIVLLAGKLARRAWLEKVVLPHGHADPWLLRALVEASTSLGEAEQRSLKRDAKRLLGNTWPVEDLTHSASNPAAATHLSTDVLRAASSQDVTLTLSQMADAGKWQEFAARYNGSVKSASGQSATLSSIDTTRLLSDAEAGRLHGLGEMPDVLEIVLADGECLFEEFPDVTLTTPAQSDIDGKTLDKALKRADILLVTSAEIERRSVLSRLVPLRGKTALLVGSRKNVTYRIGQFGRYAAAHVHTTQGPDGPHGATLTVGHALDGCEFKACFVIGIAFGFDRKMQRLGDVLIAERVQPYEHARIEGHTETYKPRGAAMHCGAMLSERFRNRMTGWSRSRAITPVALHQGTVLSGAKLVNSKPFRDRLYGQFKDLKPVGGEMEGHAAYAAAQRGATEIILVKGICDWADGDKNDRAQPFAMDMAVDACHHLLSKPTVLADLKAKDLGPPRAASLDLPDVSSVLANPRRFRMRGGHADGTDQDEEDF